MTKRNRIFVGILFAYVVGVGGLLWQLVADIDPRYRESAEESMVETAHLLATVIEQQSPDGQIIVAGLRPVFDALYRRSFEADIFGFVKTQVEMRVTVVDVDGRVIFDSLDMHEGEDHSQWRDIHRALAGEYGARTSPDMDGKFSDSVMYVAVPVRTGGQIVGAVSVGKPIKALGPFVRTAQRKTVLVGVTSVVAVLLLAVILSVWLVRPFGLVADFVRYVRHQRSISPLRIGRRAIGAIRAAFDDMRDALAGRNYVADYVQTLTHELKSPLSAIRGAAELMQEPDMPAADRARFAGNIERETQRIQELVDRMMELTALERRQHLDRTSPVALKPMLEELAASAEAAGAPRRVSVHLDVPHDAIVVGDAFLLRRAVSNLIDNALDFSPEGGTVTLALSSSRRHADVTVRDQGPGLPAYADDKVFEKFFSLERPHGQRRSTGLGLAFVQEIAKLHGGRASLRNAPGGGALATLSLPRSGALR